MEFPKRLVVNADDYGMTKSISRGILRTIKEGIVSSVSIVTNTPAFEETVSWLKYLDVDCGIHLNLSSGKPLTIPPAKITIVSRSGNFVLSPNKNPLFFFYKKSSWQDWVYYEFKKQIEVLQSRNIDISHIDSHYHIHVFPAIAPIVRKLANLYQIPFIRMPTERNLFKKLFNPSYLLLSILAHRSLKRCGKKTIPFYGLIEAGKLDVPTLKSIIIAIDTSIAEIMIHPGYNLHQNSDYSACGTDYLEVELKSATD